MKLNSALFDSLIEEANVSEKKRARVNLHESYNDPVQEMLVCLNKETRVDCHKHPLSSESYLILVGSMEIKYGIDKDHLLNIMMLDSNGNDAHRFFRVPKNYWHITTPTSENCIFLEYSSGPFDEFKTIYK